MASITKKSTLLSCLVMIHGCTTNIEPVIDGVPVDDAVVTAEEAVQDASITNSEQEAQIEVVASQPAVIALLDLSNKEQESGRIELAIAAIERALRLDSKNPALWTRLANLRLVQGSWQQAYVLANKSNSLSRNDVALRLANWRIIEVAKTRQGDTVAADEARIQIRVLSGQP